MRVVPVRIDDEDLKRIDLLVKRQAFRSRNEAIRRMIKITLSESMSDVQNVDELVKSLLKLEIWQGTVGPSAKPDSNKDCGERKRPLAYVDTGVLIAAYAPKDPLRSAARKFLGKNRASRIVSSLTFEELSSVLSRVGENLETSVVMRSVGPSVNVRVGRAGLSLEPT